MPRKPNFDTLMSAVCGGHGYCGSVQDGKFVHVTDFIPARGKVTVDDFVDWLFLAEGSRWLGDPIAMKHRETLRTYFVDHMGSSVVEAHRLRWSRR